MYVYTKTYCRLPTATLHVPLTLSRINVVYRWGDGIIDINQGTKTQNDLITCILPLAILNLVVCSAMLPFLCTMAAALIAILDLSRVTYWKYFRILLSSTMDPELAYILNMAAWKRTDSVNTIKSIVGINTDSNHQTQAVIFTKDEKLVTIYRMLFMTYANRAVRKS